MMKDQAEVSLNAGINDPWEEIEFRKETGE